MKSTKRILIGVGVLLLVVFAVAIFSGNEKTSEEENFQGDMQFPFMEGGEMPEDMNRTHIGYIEKGMPREGLMENTKVCEGFSEGDYCTIETPMGDIIEGTCQIREENLICMPEFNEGQMPPMN